MQTTYQPIKKTEQHFLEAMLYEALFVQKFFRNLFIKQNRCLLTLRISLL
jgi:hypothetical protein